MLGGKLVCFWLKIALGCHWQRRTEYIFDFFENGVYFEIYFLELYIFKISPTLSR
jgi:hypothetical protein